MLSIAFGLLLYRILYALGVVFAVLLVIPFVMNMIDGRGYGYNFKLVWGGVCKFMSLGLRKRT